MVALSKVIKQYREAANLSQESFAQELIAGFVNCNLTRQAVSLWEIGEAEPSTDFLLSMIAVYTDWRRQFATECLQAKLPEVFEVQGGMLALKYGMEAVQAVMELADNGRIDVASREVTECEK
jgi:transcriptional regulator with XRE-family HTH domain